MIIKQKKYKKYTMNKIFMIFSAAFSFVKLLPPKSFMEQMKAITCYRDRKQFLFAMVTRLTLWFWQKTEWFFLHHHLRTTGFYL